MNKDLFSKLQSSLSLDDFLDEPRIHQSQNWLLTYLDVFVLIVMLVITLITISGINTEQQAAHKVKRIHRIKCPPVSAPVIVKSCPPPEASDNKAAAPSPPSEPIVSAETDKKPPEQPPLQNDNGAETETIPEPVVKADVETEEPPKEALSETVPTETPTPEETAESSDELLREQLTKMIESFGLSQSVNVKVAQGYAQLEIQEKILFKSSEANLTAEGGALLKSLMPLLRQTVGTIMIEGHTDNIPIKTPEFRSNWELGAARATSVLHFLVLHQLESKRLRAITYADTMPIADNSTPEGREKNRRVSIVIKFSPQAVEQ